MISFKPLPLLEASIFLANKASGFSVGEYLTGLLPKKAETDGKLSEYAQIVFKIESALSESITVDNETLKKLFYPFDKRGKELELVSSDNVCNLLINDLVASYTLSDPAHFFSRMRSEKFFVPAAVIRSVTDIENVHGGLDLSEIFRAVTGSDLTQDSKLLLMDLVVNIDGYIDMLESAITPVAAAFVQLSDLCEPLIDVYRSAVSTYKDARDYLGKYCRSQFDPDTEYDMYPFIVSPHCQLVAYSQPPTHRVMGCIGVLNDFIRKNYTINVNTEAETASIMNALGHKSRFKIIEKLAKKPMYGRELANYLGLSSGTVSQHIGVLLNTGLVSLSGDGARVYYSINRKKMECFLDQLRKTFLPEQND